MRGTLLKFMVVLLVVAVVPAVTASPASALPQLPAGFTLETEQAGQDVYDLTDFAVLPDGSKWTIGKSGKVAWVSPDGVPRTIAQLPVHAHLDVGLIGVSPAPNYETTGHIYFVYAKPGATDAVPGGNEVARFTADNPADPRSLGGKVVVLGGISQELNHHGAGTVLAAPDGSIYAGFGDAATFIGAPRASLRAQNIDDPHGKILRVDAAGNGWRTNPFYDAANPRSWRSRVFALGLRNPTRFSLDPRTGRAYIGDVGWGAWEELDVARGGENFGWPCYEGPIMPAGYKDMPECKAAYANGRHDLPLYAYPHVAGGQAAVMGGALYTGTAYPPAYRNKFFFGDYAQRNLRTIGTDLNDKVVSPAAMFATQVAAPVAIRTDTNGDIVYADILSGTIKRLRYAPGNRAPVVELSVTNDPATLSVSVDASGSSDPDGDAITFSTNFGDGSAPVAGEKVTHTYANGSVTYPVTVTATDALGAKGTATVQILPSNHVPRLEVTTPPAGKLFAVNEAMTFSATATDVEDGAELAKPQFRVVLKHCPGGVECHDHPGEPSVVNPFTTNFPDHGVDTNANVTVSVKDKAGAEVSQSYEARPDVRQVTVVSPVPVKINGFTTTSLSVVAGSSVTVEAPPNWAGRQFSQLVRRGRGHSHVHDAGGRPHADRQLPHRDRHEVRPAGRGGPARRADHRRSAASPPAACSAGGTGSTRRARSSGRPRPAPGT